MPEFTASNSLRYTWDAFSHWGRQFRPYLQASHQYIGDVQVSLFGNNLLGSDEFAVAGGTPGNFVWYPLQPRTFGINFKMQF